MGEKLRVTRKTVAAEKEGALVNRRRGDCIDVSSRTQLHRSFDVTSRGFTRSARLDAWLDEATDIVEMIDDGFGELIRKRLSRAYDVVTGLQIKSACRVSQQLSITDYYRHANSSDFFFGDSLENNFRSDAGR